MNEWPTCGLWPARDRIAASVLDGEGRLSRLWMAPRDESEDWDCLYTLEREHGLALRLVVPEGAVLTRGLAHAALQREMPVIVAPARLVEEIGSVAYARLRPHPCATMLARLPDSRFRSYLRLLPTRDPRQLLLL